MTLRDHYERRQPKRRSSSSTINSSEAENIVREQQKYDPTSNTNSPYTISNHNLDGNRIQVDLKSCTNVKFEKNIINNYNRFDNKVKYLEILKDKTDNNTSLSLADNKSPENVLSDPNAAFIQKLLNLLGQKWCWGLMFFILILISFLNTSLVFLMSKQEKIIVRESIGLEPPKGKLTPLSLPVERIIVTQTGDQENSCTSTVRKLS